MAAPYDVAHGRQGKEAFLALRVGVFFFFSTRMVWRFTPDYDVFKCKAAFAFLRVVVDKIVNAMRSRLHAVRKTAYALNPRV